MKKIILLPFIAAQLALFACSGSDGVSTDNSEFQDGLTPELIAAARANLIRVTKEIDRNHMANYGLDGELADQFITAVRTEYAAKPELLKSRMQTLASMVFFSAPEVATDSKLGKVTPFHGMDNDAFEALMTNEDTVFNHHVSANGGSTDGVRPFSVCETKFLIAISKGEVTASYLSGKTISNYDGYAQAFKNYAEACDQKDLDEWYNFRGLGGLRPSWLESNLSDRFLRRMVSKCKTGGDEASSADCKLWNEDRLGYRDVKNTELALREVYYDPSATLTVGSTGESLEQTMIDPNNEGVLVEDRNGDGIGEWLATGDLKMKDGAKLSLRTGTSFKAAADTQVTLSSKLTVSVAGVTQELASGTAVNLKAGTSFELGSSSSYTPGENISLASGAKLRLPSGTSIGLSDGSTGSVVYSGSPSGAPTAKLGAALTYQVDTAAKLQLRIDQPTSGVLANNKFAGELLVSIPFVGGGAVLTAIDAGDVVAYDQVDSRWNKSMLKSADLGLLDVFKGDKDVCSVEKPTDDSCPLLRRFFSVIDRHENFYHTYSSMSSDSNSVSQQPSPLVACSITLRASHHWDTAGTPSGGTAGFIYLMRIPFSEILTGDNRSISTLGLLNGGSLTAGPSVATLAHVYSGETPLDMSKVWLDIATLSNNQYSSEHEVSKFGSVPANQIEGILVIRQPANMVNGDPVGPATPTDEDPTTNGNPEGGPPVGTVSDAGAGGQ